MFFALNDSNTNNSHMFSRRKSYDVIAVLNSQSSALGIITRATMATMRVSHSLANEELVLIYIGPYIK